MSDGEAELVDLYGRALDEVYRLRTALAYEAHLLESHLGLATFPKSRRRSAAASVIRMRDSAVGAYASAYASVEDYWLRMIRNDLGIETLTRAQFEKEWKQ